VAQVLEPAGARDIVEGMDDELVLEVAEVLLEREEYLSLGRFVDVASDEVVERVLTRSTDEQLLRLALALESTARLDDIMRDSTTLGSRAPSAPPSTRACRWRP
jgi:hypothetical protein